MSSTATPPPGPASVQFGDKTTGDLLAAYNNICQSYEDDGGISAMGVTDFEGMVEYRATLEAYFEAARTYIDLNRVVGLEQKDILLDELSDLVQFAWSTKEYLTEGTDEPLINAQEMMNDDE